MYCWKCGQVIAEGTSICHVCGADQKRTEPVSEVGTAMRKLYDQIGRDEALKNSLTLCSGLHDLMKDPQEDTQTLCCQIKLAMKKNLAGTYLSQLNGVGRPDPDFDRRVQTLLTEGAGLSEKIAKDLAGYFDEMIGWRKAPEPEPQPNPNDSQTDDSNSTSSHEEIDPNTGEVYKKEPVPPPVPDPEPVPQPVGRRKMYPFDWFSAASMVVGLGFCAENNGLWNLMRVSAALAVLGAISILIKPLDPEDRGKKLPILSLVFEAWCVLLAILLIGIIGDFFTKEQEFLATLSNTSGIGSVIVWTIASLFCAGYIIWTGSGAKEKN